MFKLTAENTNAVEHRLAGDTLVFECPNCEWGEVVVTAAIEGPGDACSDCGARFELFAERVGEGPDDAGEEAAGPDGVDTDEAQEADGKSTGGTDADGTSDK